MSIQAVTEGTSGIVKKKKKNSKKKLQLAFDIEYASV
jgi:hypothetical protein